MKKEKGRKAIHLERWLNGYCQQVKHYATYWLGGDDAVGGEYAKGGTSVLSEFSILPVHDSHSLQLATALPASPSVFSHHPIG